MRNGRASSQAQQTGAGPSAPSTSRHPPTSRRETETTNFPLSSHRLDLDAQQPESVRSVVMGNRDYIEQHLHQQLDVHR